MSKLPCPSCGEHEAGTHPIYGRVSCQFCMERSRQEDTAYFEESVYLGKSKREKRQLHWQEISHRIRTHEGELLSGRKGKDYQQKYGRKYLGIDYKPINFNRPDYQQELAKTP